MSPSTSSLENSERIRYLTQLDSALDALIKGLALEKEAFPKEIVEFGNKNQWKWTRLPTQMTIFSTLTEMVKKVRAQYDWFNDKVDPRNPMNNRAWFDKIDVSPESGLPWVYDIIALHRLKADSAKMREQMLDYPVIADNLSKLLTQDYAETSAVKAKAQATQREAMKRSFLEQIANAELLGWKAEEHSMAPKARLVADLMVEKLWNLSFVRFNPGNNFYELFVIDTFTDDQDQLIKQTSATEGEVSKRLQDSLVFGGTNDAPYMLRYLDSTFDTLHPVHLTRMIIGPFETKYLTKPHRGFEMLEPTAEIMKGNLNLGVLRCKRQYTYAPNSEQSDETIRQVTYDNDWNQEFIVCPAAHASEIAQKILGTDIRVIEYSGGENGK
jgi:hypothetical protein